MSYFRSQLPREGHAPYFGVTSNKSMKKLILIAFVLSSVNVSYSQQLQEITDDFLKWRTSNFVEEDCEFFTQITVSKEFLSWQEESSIVQNFLSDIEESEIDPGYLKYERSKKTLLTLRKLLSEQDYLSIKNQLIEKRNSTYNKIDLETKCRGEGQPIVFKYSRPIFTTDGKTVFVIERVFYVQNNCWAKQTISYQKSGDSWKEYLILSRSDACN